jgi:hypothetical protein
MNTRFPFAAVAALSVFIAAPTLACEMHAPFDINDAKNADLVVVGEIENYELVPFPQSADPHYAQFDVFVDKFLHGKSTTKVTVKWTNSTFGFPDSLPSGPVLIALEKPMPVSTRSAASQSLFDGESYTVVQAACSGPFMLNPSEEVVLSIGRVLNGQHVDQQKLKGPLFKEPSVSIFEQLKPNWKPIGAALAALLFFGFFGVTLIHGKKRKKR